MKVWTPASIAAYSRLRLPSTLMVITLSGSSASTIGPETPPACMMWVTFSPVSSFTSFDRFERSSATCVVADGRGSSPIARCFSSPSSFITALPRKPLAPVTSVTLSAMRALDDFSAAQVRDLAGAVSKTAQDLVGMRARIGQWRDHLGRRARHRDRLADHAHIAARRMMQRLGNAEVLHLRIGEDLIDL